MENRNWKMIGLAVAAILFVTGGYLAGAGWSAAIEHNPGYERQIANKAVQQGNDKLALDLYSRLAEKGDFAAAYRLGDMYQYGVGVNADASKAVKWLTKAAAAGNVNASRQLGLLYLDGEITVQDFAKARKWLRRAADAGDVAALRSLGDMNQHGLGKPADPVKAYGYYAAAVVRDRGNGSVMRDKLEQMLTADQQNQGQEEARQILARIHTGKAPTENMAASDGRPGGKKS